MHNSQEVAKVIKCLAKSKKIAIGKMLSECNLSINTLSSMQSGGYYPRLEAISKIADYFGCSIDYLLGRTDSPELDAATAPPVKNDGSCASTSSFKSDEQALITKYNELSDDSKRKIRESIDDLLLIDSIRSNNARPAPTDIPE